MTGGWLAFLLTVFVVHLVIFAWRTWRGRRLGDAVTSLTFFLLCVSFTIRWRHPGWQVLDLPVYTALRYLAWSTAAWRLLLWLHQRRPPGNTPAEPDQSDNLGKPAHRPQPSDATTNGVNDSP